jgi:ribose transport system permease protein
VIVNRRPEPRGADLDAGRQGERRSRRLFRSPEIGLAMAILAVSAIFTLASPTFLTVSTAQGVIRSASPVGLIAVGQALLILTREFDLSVGATAGLGAAVAVTVMAPDGPGLPWPLAACLGMCAGIGVGLVNGLLVTRLRVPALVVTLGMLYVASGLTLAITGGFALSGMPGDFRQLGAATPLGLPWISWLLLAIVVVGTVTLRATPLGRGIYATGGSYSGAHVAGLRPDLTKVVVFAFAGGLSAIAGILLVGRVGIADVTVGSDWALNSIAGCVVGGVSLLGGTGSVIGALLGTLFLQIVSTGFVMTGFDTSLQTVSVGGLLIVAIAIDQWRQRQFGA